MSLREEVGSLKKRFGGSLAGFQFTDDGTEPQRSSTQPVANLEFEISTQLAGPQPWGR